MSEFDPYLKWLGIRDNQRPPNHYRLLGIELFESDQEVIASAADRQMSHIRTFQTGPNGETSQRLMGELAEARRCLLNPETKSAYDQGLRTATESGPPKIAGFDPNDLLPPSATSKGPGASSEPARFSPPSLPPSSGSTDTGQIASRNDDPDSYFPSGDSNEPIIREPSSPARRRRRRSSGLLPQIIGIVGGGLAAVIVSYYIINSGLLDRFREFAKQDVVIENPAAPETNETPKNQTETAKNNRPNRSANESPNRRQPPANNRTATKQNNTAKNNPRNTRENPARPRSTNNSRRPRNPGQAPWEENRFPTVPDNWLRPRSTLDKALQPLRMSIANRRFDEAQEALKRVRLPIAKSEDKTNYDKLLIDLRNFWNHVVSESNQLPRNAELEFRGKTVKLVARSDNSVRLQYRNKIMIFPTTLEKFDRDLAVAIARKKKRFRDDQINEWIAWDYNHISLRPSANSFFAGNDNTPNVPNRSNSIDSGTPGPVVPQPTKAPVPAKKEISKIKQEIRELFPSAYERGTSSIELVRIASQMIKAAESADKKPEQYVTLLEGLQVAGENGAANVSMEGLKLLRDNFDVDFWSTAEDQLSLLTRNLRDPVQARNCFDEMLGLAQMANTEQNFDASIDIVDKAIRLAKKLNDAQRLDNATNLKKLYRETERFTVRGKRAIEALKTEPDDPETNQTAGEYFCFVANDFETGGKHLAKSNEADWKLVGQMEGRILQSKEAGREKQIADQWYKLGAQAKSFREKGAMKRAKKWYRSALSETDGLTRRVIEKRLKTIEALVTDE